MINSITRSTILTKTQYRKMSAGNPRYSDMELIATTVVGSAGVASVTFDVSTLASSYKHLQVRISSRTVVNTQWEATSARFNGDSGASYARHGLYGESGVVSSAAAASASFSNFGLSAGATAASNVYGAIITDILDAFSTTKYKTVRAVHGVCSGNGSLSTVQLGSSVWMNTAAITSIYLYASANFVAGSRFSLYGVRG